MSPRGGGGRSSSGGGRSGGSSVSSSSGSKGGSLSGPGGSRGTSSYSGGSKGGSGSTIPSYSGGSNRGSGLKPPSYSGGTYGDSGSRGSSGRKKAPKSNYNGAGHAYTSAAIPSKNNPFSFLNRRAHVQPNDQSSNVFEYVKEPFVAFDDQLLFGPQNTEFQNGMNGSQITPGYDSGSIFQAACGSECEALLSDVARDPRIPFLVVLWILYLWAVYMAPSLLARMYSAFKKERARRRKRSRKPIGPFCRPLERGAEECKLCGIQYEDSSDEKDIKIAGATDEELAFSKELLE
ncbi:MAG: hypothetical protein Q9226_002544 [Calogaya cf. arnoldii]